MIGGSVRGRIAVALTLLAALGVSAANAPSAGALPPLRSASAPAGRTLVVTRARLTAETTAEASALADVSRKPVEVLADRTDFSQTYAFPGGAFEDRESLVPVRVHEPGGSWVPVNTALSVRPGGRVAPGAIEAGLSISGGGRGPLFTLSQSSRSLSVSWPFGALPAPRLSGATATYAGVLPGVNLLVMATPTGVSEQIVVLNAAAAANPDLARLRFGVRTRGLTVTSGPHGGLAARDAADQPVFTAPAPQMWDSAGQVMADQDQGGLADHTAVVGATVRRDSIRLAPARSLLSGPAVRYPVTIDPNWGTAQSSSQTPSWSSVSKNETFNGSAWTTTAEFGSWEPQDPAGGGIHSGVSCEPDSSGTCPNGTLYTTTRSFLNFPTPPDPSFNTASYVDAQLDIYQGYSWGCTSSAGAVSMYDTEDSSGDNVPTTQSPLTSWPGPAPGVYQSRAAFDYGWTSVTGKGNCPGQQIQLGAAEAAQMAAKNNWPWLTLRLAAPTADETSHNVWTWKKFLATGADAPQLLFFWRNAPSTPASVGTQGAFDASTGQTKTSCSSNINTPDWTSTNAPVWQATINDVDSKNSTNAGNIDGEFEWENLVTSNQGVIPAAQDGNGTGKNPNPDGNDSGAAFTGQRSATWGQEYLWYAYGQTAPGTDSLTGQSLPTLTGPRSGLCFFEADNTPPAPPPMPTSTTYTSGQAKNTVGTPGQFTFSDPGNTDPIDNTNDVVGYEYGFSSSPDIYVPAPGGTATVTITPFNTNELDLYVRAVDRAGNLSPVPANPPFFAIDTTPPPHNIATLADWPANAGTGPGLVDVSGKSADATLDGGSWYCASTPAPDGYKCALSAAGGGAKTARPVAGNNGSFTVSAWAYLPTGLQNCGQACQNQIYPVISQDAANVSGFTLGYGVGCGCFEFSMPASDSTGAQVFQAKSGTARLGVWHQLTGVYDSTVQTLTLYVDGVQAGQVGGVQSWSPPASGSLRLGEDLAGDTWPGYLGDACAFYGVLSASNTPVAPETTNDIATLAGGGDGCATLAKAYP